MQVKSIMVEAPVCWNPLQTSRVSQAANAVCPLVGSKKIAGAECGDTTAWCAQMISKGMCALGLGKCDSNLECHRVKTECKFACLCGLRKKSLGKGPVGSEAPFVAAAQDSCTQYRVSKQLLGPRKKSCVAATASAVKDCQCLKSAQMLHPAQRKIASDWLQNQVLEVRTSLRSSDSITVARRQGITTDIISDKALADFKQLVSSKCQSSIAMGAQVEGKYVLESKGAWPKCAKSVNLAVSSIRKAKGACSNKRNCVGFSFWTPASRIAKSLAKSLGCMKCEQNGALLPCCNVVLIKLLPCMKSGLLVGRWDRILLC